MDNVEDESNDLIEDSIAALNKSLLGTSQETKTTMDDQQRIDDFTGDDEEEGPAKFGSSRLTFQQLQKLQNLFSGLKIFINREVPRESLCFTIRSFSGEVSWDKNLFPGATFDENDESITHQIVDRDSVPVKYVNRYYVQPQWVFDCINARTLLPVQNYFIGAKLPPHLSPFVEETSGDYVPPEKLTMLGLNQPVIDATNQDGAPPDVIDQPNGPEDDAEDPKPIAVAKGKVSIVDKEKLKQKQANEEKRLKVMMIPKKKKKLYNTILNSQKHKKKETDKLKRKREEIDMKSIKKPAHGQ